MPKKHSFAKYFKLTASSIWTFPVVLLFIVLLLTAFKISGTSISVYSYVYGGGRDSSLVFGEPRGVRSDEWLVNTQLTIAQANNGFERVNNNLGEGQDMSLNIDVPYKEWSVILKPQNLAFFLLPLEYAFAFKWWLLLFLLISSCYFLMLNIFKGSILKSVLLSLFVGFTPYIFWWYQSITLLSIAYSFLVILFVLKLFEAGSKKQRLTYSLVLAYVSACFGLLLYPPFQIPCVVVSVTFLVGLLMEEYTGKEIKTKLKSLWPYFISILILVALAGGIFYASRDHTIDTISNTVYPGKRIITAGGPTPLLSLSSHLSPNLQYDQKAASGYIANQSESSNFVFIAPYLLLPSLYMVFRKWKGGRRPWALLLINGVLLVLLLRMYVSIPLIEPLYKMLLLHKVPNTRLLLGIGLAGVLQLVLVIRELEKVKFRRHETRLMGLVASSTAAITMLAVGAYTIKQYPVFISSPYKVALFSLWITLAIYLLFRKHFTISLAMLLAFSFVSVYKVNPLYKGLGSTTNSKITKVIQAYPDKGSWVVLDDRLLINFPMMAGKDSLNFVSIYPQMHLWQKVNKDRSYEKVYNRYAHIVFSTDQSIKQDFTLPHADMFLVRFSPCEEFLQKNAKFVMSIKDVGQRCLVKKQVVNLDAPKTRVYVYEIVPSN